MSLCHSAVIAPIGGREGGKGRAEREGTDSTWERERKASTKMGFRAQSRGGREAESTDVIHGHGRGMLCHEDGWSRWVYREYFGMKGFHDVRQSS